MSASAIFASGKAGPCVVGWPPWGAMWTMNVSTLVDTFSCD
jgi:hypothetical protein